MIFKRIITSPFCSTGVHKHHHKVTDLVKRMLTAQQTFSTQQQEWKVLQQKLQQKQDLNKKKNNQIHQMRVRLTEDIRKGDNIWADAKRQMQKNKSDAINSFAKGLLLLGDQLNKTAQLQKQQHNIELKQGFELTARLFYTSLEKYNIKLTQIKQNDALKKGEFEKAGQQKTDKAELKGKVAKVVQQGWSIQGKLIRFPKVIVYA